ncbi:response regulator [Blautia schinkii]|nr:response regulator [Blautia schinkii]
MMKMIIIDDEAIIRESLSRFIDWASIGVEICDTAANGVAAMASILNLKPEIILTDIRMPGLDGLELIRLLREQNITSQVIFISAHTQFDYARRALELGAYGYVIKPVDETELLHTVAQCKLKIEEEHQKQNILSIYAADTKKRQSQILTLLLSSDYILSEEETRLLSGTPFLCSHGTAIIIAFWYDLQKTPLIPENIFEELLPSGTINSHMLITPFPELQLLLLFSDNNDLQKLYESACRLVSSVFFRKDGLIITLSLACKWEQKLSRLYTEAALTYSINKISKNTGVYSFRQIFEKCTYGYDREALQKKFAAPPKQEAIRPMLEEYVLSFVADKTIYDLEYVKLHFIHLIDSWVEQLRNYHLHSYLQQAVLSAQKTISSRQYIDQVYETAYHLFYNITTSLDEIPEPSSRQLIRNSLQYIHENFGRNFTLVDLANHLYVSPTYLSKVFSAEMGQPFSKYLLNYRVQKAIEYMENSEYKLYTIASVCGFSDVAYFSRVFKSVTGMSPQKYRNLKL